MELLIMALLYVGWIFLGTEVFHLNGAGESLPLWYAIIGLVVSIGLPALIIFKSDEAGGGHNPFTGYSGWWK